MKQSVIQAIEELARSVAQAAVTGKTKVNDKIEALRVLDPYYAALKKHKVHITADDSDETTIGGMQNALREAEGNGRTVPDHKRRRSAEKAVED